MTQHTRTHTHTKQQRNRTNNSGKRGLMGINFSGFDVITVVKPEWLKKKSRNYAP